MTSTLLGPIDAGVFVAAVGALSPLLDEPELDRRWTGPSVLPGMTVGGLAWHLVDQPTVAVDFLPLPIPPTGSRVSVLDYFLRTDWWPAPVDDEANTSIRDEFNQRADSGVQACRSMLRTAEIALPAALSAAGGSVFVPWNNSVLTREDFLLCRLLEIVVHAEDLAASLGLPLPPFAAAALDPVVSLLACLALRRHGPGRVLRALARHERAGHPVSAFATPPP